MQKIINTIRYIYALCLAGFLLWGVVGGQLKNNGDIFFLEWVGALVVFMILNGLSRSWRKKVASTYSKGESYRKEALKNPKENLPFTKNWFRNIWKVMQ